jgi:hypothetical protein
MTAGLPAQTLARLRRLLLVLLLVGTSGTAAELWLMGHHEDPWQWAPLVVLVATAGASAWVLSRWSPGAVRVLRICLGALVVSGLIGAVLHYRANMEFQLEMDASLGGIALMMKVLHAKAPPALAPGNMALLGLVGLAAVWRSGKSDV